MNTTKWKLDPSHSEVGFKIKHLMITNVSGAIEKFTASAETEGDDFTTAKISFEADMSTLTTYDAQRNGHLQSPDFFDVANHPTMTFVSTKLEKTNNDGAYEMTGDLTMKGVTNAIKLNVELGGIAKDPWGNVKAGFTITGKITRSNWGLNFNAALETGGMLLSDEVKIACEIQMVKVVEAAVVA